MNLTDLSKFEKLKMSRLIRAKDILKSLRQPPEELQFHDIVVPVSELEREQKKAKIQQTKIAITKFSSRFKAGPVSQIIPCLSYCPAGIMVICMRSTY